MTFQQPDSRTRAMSQVVDLLIAGSRVTLTFQTESEALHGLEALHEVATLRRIAVAVEPCSGRIVEV